MAETGIVRFPGSLDPRAQEFRPRNITNPLLQGTTTVIPTPPPQPHQLFFPLYPPAILPYAHHHNLNQFPLPPLAYVAAEPIFSPAQPPSSAAARSLMLSLVPSDVTESVVRRELEAFGELRGVQMERVSDGIVTVHFYDLRHAESALREIRNQHLQQQSRIRRYYTSYYGNAPYSVNRPVEIFQPVNAPLSPPVCAGLIAGRAVWAQFVSPSCNAAVPDSHNQGTIVVFNLDSDVSTTFLRDIFEVYGAVRELRETPTKKQQRFVEFYDVRDAAKALNDMNGKAVFGKPVVIEFSRPGGHHNNNNRNSNNKSSSFNDASCHGRQKQQRPPPPPPVPIPRHFPPHPSPPPPPRSYHSQQAAHQIFPTKKLSSTKKAILNNNSVVVEREHEKKTASLDSKKSGGGHHNSNTNKVNRKGGGRMSSSRKHDYRFLIDNNAMLESDFRDSRTTVMIKNIPNKYSLKLLLNMLDNHCIHCNEQILADADDDDHDRQQHQPFSSYDFVYLPIDFINKCNVGYGFVNMTSPEATWRLYKAFHLQHWEVFNSRKICEVTYARVQGLEALKEHFKNSKFPSEMDNYLPVLFSPPRDGKSQLTEPLPIVANCKHHPDHLISTVGSAISQNPDDHDQNDEIDGDEARLQGNSNTTTDHLLLAGSSSSRSSDNGGVVGVNIDEDGGDYSRNTDS